MASERDLALMDDYFRNRLTNEERAIFEQRLQEDADLRQAYNLQHEIINGIRRARKAELKALLNSIPVPPVENTKLSPGAKWTGLGIVAALVGAGVLFYFQGEEQDPVSPRSPQATELPSETTAPILPKPSPVREEQRAPQEQADHQQEKESGRERPANTAPVTKQEAPPTRKMDVFDPTGEMEQQPTENVVAPPASASPSPDKHTPTITTEIIDSKKYSFHYQFKGDRLLLYGTFEQNLYEILEFFTDNKRTVFLFYKDNFYLLNDESEKIKPLQAVTDPALLQKLQQHRGH